MANKKKPNTSGKRAVVVTMLLALLGVGVFATYVKMTPAAAHVADDLRARPSITQRGPDVQVQGQPVNGRTSIHELMIPRVSGMDVKLSTPAKSPPAGVDPKVFLLDESFRYFGIRDGRVLAVQIEGKNAIVDVNDAVVNHGYGGTEEGQFVQLIQQALGQFPEVDTFQVRNNGKVVDSLGSLDFSSPTPVTRPGAAPAESTRGEG
jgi:hypothetical protein